MIENYGNYSFTRQTEIAQHKYILHSAGWNSSLFCATPFPDSFLGLFPKENLQWGSWTAAFCQVETEWLFHSLFPKAPFESWNTRAQRSARHTTGEAGMQSLPSVCTSCQLLPFCYDNSYAVIASVAVCAIRRSFSQRIHGAKSICHTSASPAAFMRTSLKQYSTVLGLAGGGQLDLNCFPSYRVELPCHPVPCGHEFRLWYLQN